MTQYRIKPGPEAAEIGAYEFCATATARGQRIEIFNALDRVSLYLDVNEALALREWLDGVLVDELYRALGPQTGDEHGG